MQTNSLAIRPPLIKRDTHIPRINLKQRRVRRSLDIRQHPDSYTTISSHSPGASGNSEENIPTILFTQ